MSTSYRSTSTAIGICLLPTVMQPFHIPMPADDIFYVGLLCDVCVCVSLPGTLSKWLIFPCGQTIS